MCPYHDGAHSCGLSSQDKPRKSGLHFVRSDQLFIRISQGGASQALPLDAMGEAGYRRRIIVVGTSEDVEQAKKECGLDHADDLEVVAEVDINQEAVASFVDILHRHSANGVLLATKHSFLEALKK